MAEARTHNVLGTDLALTRFTGVASAVPLDSADSWGTLDLSVAPSSRGGARQKSRAEDLRTVSARDNLGQALILRLLTTRGALAHLGHPDFGSRLVELIGRLNNETTRNLARLYTIQALGEEPRVKEVVGIDVRTAADRPDVIRISFAVLPLGDDEPLAQALEITL